MRILVSVTLSLVLLAAACGGRERTPVDLATDAPGININGKEFWSTSVNEGGINRPLAEGTRISLRFEAGGVRVGAGCNNIGGTYAIDDNVMVIDSMFSTEMGCDSERHAQDEFIIEVLNSQPTLATGTNTLTITTPKTMIELVDREVVETDNPLIETQWVVEGFFDPITATSNAVDNPAHLVFEPDGQVAGFDCCGPFEIAYRVTEIAVTLAVAPLTGCSEYSAAFSSILGRGTLLFEIRGTHLTLTAEDGTGLTARAD